MTEENKNEFVQRYRYRIFKAKNAVLLIRDDGYRWWFQAVEATAENLIEAGWVLLFEYKQCDFPGPASEIIDFLFSKLEQLSGGE